MPSGSFCTGTHTNAEKRGVHVRERDWLKRVTREGVAKDKPGVISPSIHPPLILHSFYIHETQGKYALIVHAWVFVPSASVSMMVPSFIVCVLDPSEAILITVPLGIV